MNRPSLLKSVTTTLIVSALVLIGMALAARVQAHADYERSEPGDGASVASSPPRVDVWFGQEIRRSGGLPTLTVVNKSGDTVSRNSVLDDRDRTHMSAELGSSLAPGRYTVIWRTLSDGDGEEAEGAFHFYVGVESPLEPSVAASQSTAAPSIATVPSTITPIDRAPDNNSDNGPLLWGLLGVGGGFVAGAVAGSFLSGRSRT